MTALEPVLGTEISDDSDDTTARQLTTLKGWRAFAAVLGAALDEDEDDRLGEHVGAWCAVRVEGVVVTMAL